MQIIKRKIAENQKNLFKFKVYHLKLNGKFKI